MAQHAHPPISDAMALGPRPLALLGVLREATAELSGQELHERLTQTSLRGTCACSSVQVWSVVASCPMARAFMPP